MFSSKKVNNLEFAVRQFANTMENMPADAALERLEEALPAEFGQDIATLKKLIDGDTQTDSALGLSPYRAMVELLPTVGKQRHTMFREFVDYVQRSKIVFETYWAGVMGLMWYLAAVTLVALSVSAIFSRFVVPSFSSMFGGFGADLPDFSRATFDFSGKGIPLIAVVLGLLFLAVLVFVTLFHRRIQQLLPLPRWPRWVPLFGRIVESYNVGLFLNIARILRRCGVNMADAVTLSASASNQPAELSLASLQTDVNVHSSTRALTELGIATRLGNFDAELEHQCEQHVGELTLVLVETRDRFALVLKIVLFVFVAALIVAMYLPIFKMGSVI